MAKQRPAFSEDLRAIHNEVENDVGVILDLAKQAKAGDVTSPARTAEVGPPQARIRRTNRSSKAQPTIVPDQPSLVQNVTTRLSQRTNELLTEAALRQRLKKTTPASRQDIIEQAVSQWLKLHGYDDVAE